MTSQKEYPRSRGPRQTTGFAGLRVPQGTKSAVVIRSDISKADMKEHGTLADASSKVMIRQSRQRLLFCLGLAKRICSLVPNFLGGRMTTPSERQ